MSLPKSFFDRIVFLLKNYGMSYLQGAGRTIVIALISTIIGCIIGFVVGVIRTIPTAPSDKLIKRVFMKLINLIFIGYIELFRGTPMMVQAAVIYYGLMQLFSIDLNIWTAGILIVSINTGAYMSETVRGGIESIDRGQFEGAMAIGMNHYQIMSNVVLPQALRNILPQIGNNLIINIKDTSVLSIISVTELMFQARTVAGVYYTFFETYAIACVMYLVMTLTCAKILRMIERRMDGSDHYDLAMKDPLVGTSGMMNHPGRKSRQK